MMPFPSPEPISRQEFTARMDRIEDKLDIALDKKVSKEQYESDRGSWQRYLPWISSFLAIWSNFHRPY